jgi:hypothetical protein
LGDVKKYTWEILLAVAVIIQIVFLEFLGFDEKNQIEIEHLRKAFLRLKVNRKWKDLMNWDPIEIREKRQKTLLSYYKRVNPQMVEKHYQPHLISEISRKVAFSKLQDARRSLFCYIAKGMDNHMDQDFEKISPANIQNRLWRIFSRFV